MKALIAQAITVANTFTSPEFLLGQTQRDYLAIQTKFNYGSGGTTCKVFLQTSFDDGVTWIDVVCQPFTTAILKAVSAICKFIAPGTQSFAPVTGALADSTVVNGVFGTRWRLQIVSVGTYAATTVDVDVIEHRDR